MNKEYLNYLVRREAILKVSEDTFKWDKKILEDSWISLIELQLKTNLSSNPKAKEFYTEHLDKIKLSLMRQEKMKHEWDKLEKEYETLYNKYSDLLTINLELQEKVSKFENEF